MRKREIMRERERDEERNIGKQMYNRREMKKRQRN